MTEPDRIAAHAAVATHVADGLRSLAQQFRGRAALEALASSWLAQVQELETAAWGLYALAIDDSAAPIRDENGSTTHYVCIKEDITERKRQDDALRQSEQRLQRTGQVARVGGWELDLATGALVWSGQTHEIHGVPPDFVPEVATAINFYAPEARPKIQTAVETAMTTGEGWDLELPFIQANGTEIWVRAVGAAEFHDGAPVRLVVPWKYGFKSGKSIVKIRFTDKQPGTAWNKAAANEYGFYSNVNPTVDHPRWSQSSERRIGEDGLFAKKRKTLMFNGYEAQVGQLYAGMDLKKFY